MAERERTHDCPGGCGAKVQFAMLACRQDWFRLPARVRRDVNWWWPRRDTYPTQWREALAAALGWYRANPRTTEGVPGG